MTLRKVWEPHAINANYYRCIFQANSGIRTDTNEPSIMSGYIQENQKAFCSCLSTSHFCPTDIICTFMYNEYIHTYVSIYMHIYISILLNIKIALQEWQHPWIPYLWGAIEVKMPTTVVFISTWGNYMKMRKCTKNRQRIAHKTIKSISASWRLQKDTQQAAECQYTPFTEHAWSTKKQSWPNSKEK